MLLCFSSVFNSPLVLECTVAPFLVACTVKSANFTSLACKLLVNFDSYDVCFKLRSIPDLG